MTATDLQQYTILVDFLGKTLGPDYEVVLQDLTNGNNAIVAIANGHISGRRIGSPLTNAALQMLASKTYEDNDFVCNYKGITEKGRILRSSTMFLKDEDGRPFALLCINFDDSRYQELSQKLKTLIHPDNFGAALPRFDAPLSTGQEAAPAHTSLTENFSMDIPTLMQKIFDDCICGITTPIDRLNQYERKDVISRLNEQGLFQLKGAISFVAKKFSCSTATIYRYLSEITT